MVQYGILEPISRFLVKVEPANELQYWSLMVVHQLAACGKYWRQLNINLSGRITKISDFVLSPLQIDALHPELIRADLIRTLAEMSRLSFGNANMPKVCLQALVRLISTMDDDDDAQWYLTELLDYDIVLLIATYIRSGK